MKNRYIVGIFGFSVIALLSGCATSNSEPGALVEDATDVEPITNVEDGARKLRKKYLDAINRIKKEGTDVDIAYMEEQLGILSDPSQLENYLPTEGITFLYKNKLYKLTGYFQVLNRICGYFKYKK
jgi:hypothetical protein